MTITDDDRRLWKHVDHDFSRLVELHGEINGPRWAGYPTVVRKGCNVAYAAAFRSVMEFAHSSRPSGGLHPRSITSEGLCGVSLAEVWTQDEKDRVADADKLVAHLSKDRVPREGLERDWGDPKDRDLWEPYVRGLLSDWGEHLPETSAAWDSLE